jgi:hypothetical protein
VPVLRAFSGFHIQHHGYEPAQAQLEPEALWTDLVQRADREHENSEEKDANYDCRHHGNPCLRALSEDPEI